MARNRLRVQRAAGGAPDADAGIGTKNESSLHSSLKSYLEPDESCHEVRIGRFIADIAGARGVTEIQTRNFFNLRKKLSAFLENVPVTIVYPVAGEKRVYWVDPETGERTGGRRSPKRGSALELLRELPALGDLAEHPRLSYRVVMLNLDEYRYRNGWSNDGKRGATRMDRVMLGVTEDIFIASAAQLVRHFPDGLPDGFTASELAKKGGISVAAARAGLAMLCKLGAVERIARDRLGYHYRVTLAEDA